MLRFSIHTQTVFMMSTFLIALVVSCERSSPPASPSAPPAEESGAQAHPSPAPAETSAQPPTAGKSAVVAAKQLAVQEQSQEEGGAADVVTAADTKFVAYYFHRTLRCPTCLAIEEQARNAVETGYLEELEAGKLEWHPVNIEEPGNEHFESDFELSTSSLVLVEMKGDEIVRWKNLEDVWELVHDGPAFQKYVWTELTTFLEL
ncbi:MAG: hypothetical protein JSV78_09415 [Phycisphaerales bacterium]|nr:MAG: hypothetical protein JSV78_09415 [Phycisphaerales bacterium]